MSAAARARSEAEVAVLGRFSTHPYIIHVHHAFYGTRNTPSNRRCHRCCDPHPTPAHTGPPIAKRKFVEPISTTTTKSTSDGPRCLFIVLEYAAGGDLAERIEAAKRAGAPFTTSRALSWFTQVRFPPDLA